MILVSKQASRDISIDSLRGLAVILMVAGHVIGSTGDSGMRVVDDSAWRWFYLMLEDIRMPLFTVLSGYVYAMRPLRQASGYGKLIKGKTRRLLIPLLVVGTIFYLSQTLLPGTNNAPALSEIWRVYVYGYGHFWFLLALFLIFMVVPALDSLGALSTIFRWITVFSCSIFAFVVTPRPDGPDILASFGALKLLPFFLLGYGLNVYSTTLQQKVLLVCAVAFATTGFYLKVGMVHNQVDQSAIWSKTVAVGLGICVLYTVLWFRGHFQAAWMAWLGQRSFSIYLLHVFGTAGARITTERLGWENAGVVFVTSLLAGVLLPVVLELLFGRYRSFSWSILGQKPQKYQRLMIRSGEVP